MGARAGACDGADAVAVAGPLIRAIFPPPMDDLVTVTTFPDVPEAELARDRLELEGIRAFVLSAQTTGVMPFLAASSGGVRVQVKPQDLARAKEILGS